MKKLPEVVSLIAGFIILVWSAVELYRTMLADNSAKWFFLIMVLLSCVWVRAAHEELNEDDDNDETGALA